MIDLEEFQEVKYFLEKNKEIVNLLVENEKIAYIGERYLEIKDFCGYLGEGETKVLCVPGKLSEHLNVDQFEEIFKKFLRYIVEKLAEEKIIYTLSLFRESVEESRVNNSPIFKLLLLLEKKDLLIGSIHMILSNLHRKLVEYERYKSLEEVSYIDENVLTDILQHPEFLHEAKNGVIQGRYSPTNILQYEAEETFDTLENRFVKHFLKEIESVLSYELKDFLFIPALKQIKKEIEFALQSDILSEVGELSYFPSNSQVLMKRAGYRELFQIFRLFHLSFVPRFFKNIDLAFFLKDMATLWEYYVLICLLKEFKKEENFGNYTGGIFREKVKRNTIYDYAEFKFEKGLRLYFQRTKKSYSGLDFRPDFYIEYEGYNYIFDAKFRIFKNNIKDILQNMHYYKDGLNAKFAIAVCLGENNTGKSFTEDNERGEKIEINEIVDNIKGYFKGIGYINLSLKY